MITISSGHWKVGTGAKGYIDEVTEARKIVTQVGQILKKRDVNHIVIIDNVSNNVKENLHYLITQHEKYKKAQHVSIHFNSCAGTYHRPIGCEVLYKGSNMKSLAEQMSYEICAVSKLKNRGAKIRTNLRFLNSFPSNSILIEVCFVNSKTDVELYQKSFQQICLTIANILASK